MEALTKKTLKKKRSPIESIGFVLVLLHKHRHMDSHKFPFLQRGSVFDYFHT